MDNATSCVRNDGHASTFSLYSWESAMLGVLFVLGIEFLSRSIKKIPLSKVSKSTRANKDELKISQNASDTTVLFFYDSIEDIK